MVMDAESDERLKLCSNKPEAGDINSVFYSAKRMGEEGAEPMKNDHFRHCKNLDNLKSKDDSECASSVGPLEERDPLQVWKKMKKNGFLSESHGFVSMPKPKPKPKSRKAKSDGIKNKIEIAKQEQVDRFAKFAAPSGLLNGLNPGIINHVRNGKQVHSIIEALVKSESKEQRVLGGTADASHVDPENISSLSNEDSANMTSVNSLSVKAASVASQWLELLHQDVKGRLAALRRSKKRVEEVIQSDFPHMLAREFPSMNENSVSTTESSVSHSNNATAEMHRTRWGSLFHQMETALLEEEKQLENWLSQVKQMQVHCDLGLFNYNTANELPQIGGVDIHCRAKKDAKLESDPSILAAAASIYSTCNFISSMENLPCR